MVRVSHPPGGKMKLHAEAVPDARTVRVLKPPGGGSSIVFDEDENMKPIKSKPQQQEQKQSPPPSEPEPEPQPKEEAPQADKPEKQEKQPPQQEAVEPKPESNGMNKHDSVKEDVAATTTRDSNPTPAPATNGQQSPALNGSQAVNGSNGINGSVSSGSTSSMSPYPGGTPKHYNTQNRIFGENQQNGGNPFTPRRRLRDHERSTIFTPDAASNGTHRPDANGSGSSSSSCLSSGTPEARTPDPAHSQPQQQQQRQRVPPGGFSTQLW